MKKTALQEAIIYLTKESLSTGNSNRDVIKYLESLLEKEEQDLIEAFKEGYIERELEDLDMDEYADFEDYYKQNFQQ